VYFSFDENEVKGSHSKKKLSDYMSGQALRLAGL
jgi:hypothetical protein